MISGKNITIGTPEILIFSGAAIIIFGSSFTTGIVFSSVGILGSAIRYAMNFQLLKEEIEAKDKIYQDIKNAATSPVQTILSEASKFLH